MRSLTSAPAEAMSPGSEGSTEARVSRTRRAFSAEIWRVSEMASASIRGEDLWRSFSLRRARVAEPSEKMSFEIGRSPYSKGSRRRWRRKGSFADGDCVVEPLISPLIFFFIERARLEKKSWERKWK